MLNIGKHFALLGLSSAGAVAVAAAPVRVVPGLVGQFALYGALHAGALVLSLDAAAAPSTGRRAVLIAAGAMLAWLTARLGLVALHTAAALTAPGGPTLVLAIVTGLGALVYGLSIGGILGWPLRPGSLAAIALGCAAATGVAFEASRRLHLAGALWLVVPWWLAFSGGFCWASIARDDGEAAVAQNR